MSKVIRAGLNTTGISPRVLRVGSRITLPGGERVDLLVLHLPDVCWKRMRRMLVEQRCHFLVRVDPSRRGGYSVSVSRNVLVFGGISGHWKLYIGGLSRTISASCHWATPQLPRWTPLRKSMEKLLREMEPSERDRWLHVMALPG